MSRPSIAVVVLVLALSAVVAAGAVTQEDAAVTTPVVGTTPGEPNHLAINESEVRRGNTTTLDLDVGSAISADGGSLQATYLRLQFEAAYENASTAEARERVVEKFRERLGNRSATLEARNRENIEAYASGSITAGQFLRERATIESKADRLEGAVSDMKERVPRSLERQFFRAEGRLEVLQGSNSEVAARTLSSGGTGRPIYVEVSDSGYTLASLSGQEYVRETYLEDNRYPEQPDRFSVNGASGLGEASDWTMNLYPWVRNNTEQVSSTFPRGQGVYLVNKGFTGGVMNVYVSGGTGGVFWEHQARTLTSFNTTQSVNRTEGSLRLTVNRTFQTGPAEIQLRDTATDSPINGTVSIGNRDPRWVGDDGRLWVVEPRGDVTLNATAGTTRISTSMSGT